MRISLLRLFGGFGEKDFDMGLEKQWLSILGSNYLVLTPMLMSGSNLMGPVMPSHQSYMVLQVDPRP